MIRNNHTEDQPIPEEELVKNIQNQFHSLGTKSQFQKVLKDLQRVLQTIKPPFLPTIKNDIIELIRKTNVNINFFNRYEELRLRYLEGEDESIYDDLIKLNSDVLRSENYFVTSKITNLIQQFLSRIGDLIHAKKEVKEKDEALLKMTPDNSEDIHTFFPNLNLGSETVIQRNEPEEIHTIPPAQLPSFFTPNFNQQQPPILGKSESISIAEDFQTIPPAFYARVLPEVQSDNSKNNESSIPTSPFPFSPFPQGPVPFSATPSSDSPSDFPSNSPSTSTENPINPFPVKSFESPFTHRIIEKKPSNQDVSPSTNTQTNIPDENPKDKSFSSPFNVDKFEKQKKMKPNPYSATYAMEIMQKLVESNSKVMNPDEEDALPL